MKKIAIIGAGVAGLTAAWRLARAGHAPTVYERSRPGGLAAGFKIGEVSLEKYFHHIFTTDIKLIEICEELGIKKRLMWLPSSVGFYSGGKIHPLQTPADLLRFPPLALADRVRLGLSMRHFQKTPNWRPYDDISASDWHAKKVGGDVYDTFWAPLMRQKFGDHADGVSAAWLWGRIYARARSRQGSVERLGYMDGGFQILIDRLVEEIERRGGRVLFHTPANRILASGRKFEGVASKNGEEKYDLCLATCPMPQLLSIAPTLDPEYKALCESVQYRAVACMAIVMNRPLSDIYWLNVDDPEICTAGVIEHTNLVPPEKYAGWRIAYLFNYLSEHDSRFSMGAEELLKRHYLPDLKRLFPGFDENRIKGTYLFKDRYATPVYTVGYASRMAPHASPIEGLYVANTAQIYPQDRNMSHSAEIADRCLEIMGLAQK